MHHQHWHSDLLEIVSEIGLRKGDNAVVVRLRATHHALAPPVSDGRLRGFYARPIETIEGARRYVEIELRSIGRELRLKSVEDVLGKTSRVGRRFQHQGRHRADQRSLRHTALSMPSQIARNLAAAG